jgi:hypothetical protein
MHTFQVQTKQFARCNAGKIVLANCERVVWHMSPGVRPATVRVAVPHLRVQMPHDPPHVRIRILLHAQRTRHVLHEERQQPLSNAALPDEAHHLRSELVQPRTRGANAENSLH